MQLRTMIFWIATVAVCALAGNAVAEEQTKPAATSASRAIDDFIAQQMDEAGIMGLGAAIIMDKKVVWTKGYGFADKERALPFTPDTVMNIGSISKTFTKI